MAPFPARPGRDRRGCLRDRDLLLLAFVGAPLAENRLGHGPNDINSSGGLDADSSCRSAHGRRSARSRIRAHPPGNFEDTIYILGADSQLGRDMFLRLLYGAQTSLQVAILATLLSVSIGLIMGLIAGYYRGWVDTLVSRLTEVVMAFPYLLFVIALAATVGERLNTITFGGLLQPGVFTLVMIFGIFGWFYPARIIRSQILSLREKEFVEAARMTGASDWRIMKSHLLPHLVAPLIVYSTLIVANNIIGEAGLSFLGLGIPAPTAELGEPPRRRAELLPDPAVADGLAGARDPADDALLQPARRRPARRLRSSGCEVGRAPVPDPAAALGDRPLPRRDGRDLRDLLRDAGRSGAARRRPGSDAGGRAASRRAPAPRRARLAAVRALSLAARRRAVARDVVRQPRRR